MQDKIQEIITIRCPNECVEGIVQVFNIYEPDEFYTEVTCDVCNGAGLLFMQKDQLN